MRARVGVLENVRGPAGGGLGAGCRDDGAWERFRLSRELRGRVVNRGGQVIYAKASWRRSSYAEALSEDPTATLDDLHEAVNTLEDMVPTARRVFGPSHPTTEKIERSLRLSRSTLRNAQNSEAFRNWKALQARETPPSPGSS